MYQGRRIAFTGVAQNYDRNQIHAAIAAFGATLDKSVTRHTDLLVTGESGVNGSKRKNAAQFGTPTVMADAFMQGLRTGTPVPLRPPRAPRVATAKKSKRPPKDVTAAIRSLAKEAAPKGFVGF